MTWPHRVLELHVYFGPYGVESLFWDRMTELFNCQLAQIKYVAIGHDFHPIRTAVKWEGHDQVHCRVGWIRHDVLSPESVLPSLRPREEPSTHKVRLLVAVAEKDDDLFSVLEQTQPKRHGHWEPYFSTSRNVRVGSDMILIRSLEELSINQIFHLVRGNLPLNFPTLEEFSSGLPQTVLEKASENFKANVTKSSIQGAIEGSSKNDDDKLSLPKEHHDGKCNIF